MTQSLAQRPGVVAGLIRALCTCCAEPQPLQPHAQLDATRLCCPQTLMSYLDRGDGVFEPDGNRLTTAPEVPSSSEPEILSDRPARTGAKTRIVLEKATFA
jgi:hypothetical protein